MSARSKSGPDVNRLLDIVVEEVSLVDRAANKHRFLIVKRSDEMDETTTNPTAPADEPSAEGNPAAADEAKPTGETNNTDSASAKDEGGQDSSPLSATSPASCGGHLSDWPRPPAREPTTKGTSRTRRTRPRTRPTCPLSSTPFARRCSGSPS